MIYQIPISLPLLEHPLAPNPCIRDVGGPWTLPSPDGARFLERLREQVAPGGLDWQLSSHEGLAMPSSWNAEFLHDLLRIGNSSCAGSGGLQRRQFGIVLARLVQLPL